MKRQPNLIGKQKLLILELLCQHKDIIEPKDSKSSSVELKDAAWTEVEKVFNSQCDVYRTKKQLQDAYNNLRRLHRNIHENNDASTKRKYTFEAMLCAGLRAIGGEYNRCNYTGPDDTFTGYSFTDEDMKIPIYPFHPDAEPLSSVASVKTENGDDPTSTTTNSLVKIAPRVNQPRYSFTDEDMKIPVYPFDPDEEPVSSIAPVKTEHGDDPTSETNSVVKIAPRVNQLHKLPPKISQPVPYPQTLSSLPPTSSISQVFLLSQAMLVPQKNSVPQGNSVPQVNAIPQGNSIPHFISTPQVNSVPVSNSSKTKDDHKDKSRLQSRKVRRKIETTELLKRKLYLLKYQNALIERRTLLMESKKKRKLLDLEIELKKKQLEMLSSQ